VLPAETGQLARAVSFVKGCYLGQEVVERMRSHGAVARRFVPLRLQEVPSSLPVALLGETAEAGRLTSACWSPAAGGPIGLGYVRTALGASGARLHVGEERVKEADVLPRPVRPSPGH